MRVVRVLNGVERRRIHVRGEIHANDRGPKRRTAGMNGHTRGMRHPGHSSHAVEGAAVHGGGYAARDEAHGHVRGEGPTRGARLVLRLRGPYPLATGAPPATHSATRSPIINTVACKPPERGMRGTIDASTTHRPCTP